MVNSIQTHIYKVGIVGEVSIIESPTAEAAALFYGLLYDGNMQLLTIIYEEDGKPFCGEPLPLAKYRFAKHSEDELKQMLSSLLPQMEYCRIKCPEV